MRNKSKRPLHKKVALHPISILLLLCFGVLLVETTVRVHAEETITVSAKVSAPLPSAPAIVEQPANQSHVTTQIITVQGTCSPETAYVSFVVNGGFGGVAACQSGAFSAQVSLVPGENSVQVRSFNATDDEGPVSLIITIFYDPPQQEVPEPSPEPTPEPPLTVTPSQPGVPLTAGVPYSYQMHFAGSPFEWQLIIAGGVPPYTIIIDWKDGETTELTSQSGTVLLRHAYQRPGTFEPLVTIRDAAGNLSVIQLLAVVKALPHVTTNTALIDTFSNYLSIAWPTYGAVTLVVFSFWLGEFELLRLRGRRRPS